ncbi:DNA polymerase III PolC-type [Clostridium acetireducens DSM 10703]|jgi:predicted metal-dependent phosphoesterase TrpH|uniref:DNA polymerase III PolC-type n=1 Tax=Clostridium acetireducens DSM 10703 TaxID=1121290 RepID=A0A1E8EYE3_9CLOT|nr:PHP domain-containing protein [Clostridium acetireducens]OFI05570.1 DNA polymerase III PolC-type [Clostridium acetireducens DSM 10703]
MYKKGDFHIHSNASDGKFSPKDIVHLSLKQNMDIISITDHDTINGINEALEESKKVNIKVIPGIELSTLYKGENIHILGYFKNSNYKNSNLQNFLKNMECYRIYRAKKIIENLYEFFHIKLDADEIIKKSNGIIARPHIAKAIIDAGYDYTWEYIFNNLISDKSPAYVPNKKLSLEEGIKLLKYSNALVVLAHPVLIHNCSIEELLNFEFDGIEAIYYSNTPKETFRFKNLAKKYNKIITAGSDFHGITKSDGLHALNIGDVYLTKEYIKIFLEKLNQT